MSKQLKPFKHINYKDIFMAPVTKTDWINLYIDPITLKPYVWKKIYNIKEEANASGPDGIVATIQITWEE